MGGHETALRGWRPGLADGQRPFAVILGCSDSRAPAEDATSFDQGLGDLFVIRVAGNIVAPSLVGSIEFAASQFGTRLVVVMGHSQCGAIAASLHAIDHEGIPESKNLAAIVDRIVPNLTNLPPANDPERSMVATRTNARASARALVKMSPLSSVASSSPIGGWWWWLRSTTSRPGSSSSWNRAFDPRRGSRVACAA